MKVCRQGDKARAYQPKGWPRRFWGGPRGDSTVAKLTRRPTVLWKRKSVFVVDDDPSVRTSMKRLLREHDFHATLFESGAALLSHGDFGKAFCLVLDINLNDESGIDLRRHLADKEIGLPVIYITGNDSQAHRAAAIESGCIAYLTKPFAARSLIEPIERLRAAGA